MTDCEFCAERDGDDSVCADTSPRNFGCIREPDHDGDHVACGASGMHELDRWENKDHADD